MGTAAVETLLASTIAEKAQGSPVGGTVMAEMKSLKEVTAQVKDQIVKTRERIPPASLKDPVHALMKDVIAGTTVEMLVEGTQMGTTEMIVEVTSQQAMEVPKMTMVTEEATSGLLFQMRTQRIKIQSMMPWRILISKM